MKNNIQKRSGVTAIEYAILIMLVALAILSAVFFAGKNLNNVFNYLDFEFNISSNSNWTLASTATYVCADASTTPPNSTGSTTQCSYYELVNSNGAIAGEFTPGTFYDGGSYNKANLILYTTSSITKVPVGSTYINLPPNTQLFYSLANSNGSLTLGSNSSSQAISDLQNFCNSYGCTYSLFTYPDTASGIYPMYSNMPTCNNLPLDTSANTNISKYGLPNLLN